MTGRARTILATIFAMSAVMTAASANSAGAKAHRHHPVAKIAVVGWPAPAHANICAREIYPYAPSICLPGGYILFDEKAYFAPRYGHRAYRYFDGW